MTGDDVTDTQELRLEQVRRADGEREAAQESETPAETRAHRRRAERARYLSEKLAERERSEREAQGDA